MVLTKQEGWRFTITADGEQFVMITGTSTMLVLSADSLVFQMLRMLIKVVTLVKGLDRFGLTMLIVTVMSHGYLRADIMDGEVTTVIIVKTPGYDVKILEVRMNVKYRICKSTQQRNIIIILLDLHR